MRYFYYYISLLVALCLLCNACVYEDEPVLDGQQKAIVTLLLPGVLTRAANDDAAYDGDNSDNTIDINIGGKDEGGIDSDLGLWFFAFPREEGKGKKLVRKITNLPAPSESLKNNHRKIDIELEYGTYDFYLAGNIPDLDKVVSAESLKHHLLRYTAPAANPSHSYPIHELRPGRLPMFREALEVIVGESTQTEEVDMHMTFLCSKVQLKFKPQEPEAASGDGMSQSTITFQLREITLSYAAPRSLTDLTACQALGNFSTDEFISNINLSLSAATGQQEPTEIPIEIGTENRKEYSIPPFYLPEYYVNGGKEKTRLLIRINDDDYTFPLGGDGFQDAKPLGECQGGDLERGKCYDITAIVASIGVNINLSLFKWTTEDLDADFSKTTLWVSKTGGERNVDGTYKGDGESAKKDTILATSLIPATIAYRTNAAGLDINCPCTINDKPILIAEQHKGNSGSGDSNSSDNYISFTINPDIALSEFENAKRLKGQCKVIITANNLRKEIWVDYDVTPFLTVDPTSILFENGDAEGKEVRVTYNTNLRSVSLSIEDERVQLNTNDKTITVKRGNNTDGYAFNLIAQATTGTTVLTQTVRVNYERSDIRVNFMAINDRMRKEHSNDVSHNTIMNLLPLKSEGGIERSYNYEKVLPQTYDTNSNIYWHNPKIKVNGKQYDMESAGEWYSCTLSDANASLRFIRVGDYYDYEYPGSDHTANDTPFQYPYNNGTLSVFHFAGGEGWLVWDPTVEACSFWDFKPEIVDVDYEVYVYSETPVQGVRWYRGYGWIKNNTGRFLIQSEMDTNGAYNRYEVYRVADNWYKCTIRLKAMQHDKHKNIKLMFRTQNGSIDVGEIYGGMDFSTDNITENKCIGYYDAYSTWHKGKPEGISESGEKTNVQVNIVDFGVDGEDPDHTQGDKGYIRVYFYNPQEPSSWVDPLFGNQVYLHMGFTVGGKEAWPDGGVISNTTLLPVRIDEKVIPNWYYYEISNPNFPGNSSATYYTRWKQYRTESNQVLFMAFRNRFYDSTHDDANNKYYKFDLWAWANRYNGYMPDIRINYTYEDRKRDKYTDGWASGAAFYCMDGRCYFNRRPR